MNEMENKNEYEMAYLLTPEVAEDKVDSEVNELKKIIAENGGDIVQANPPEIKRLAYPVKKQNQAYLGVIYFNIDKNELDKIQKGFALHKKILRFSILSHSTNIEPKQPESPTTPVPTQSFDQKLENILNR